MPKISFLVSGEATQEIEIVNKRYTIEKIVAGLAKHELFTSLTGDCIVKLPSFKTVAKIVDQDTNCEYSCFGVEDAS